MGGLMARITRHFQRREGVEKGFLKKIPILSGLDDGELDQVWAIVKKSQIPAGRTIVTEGEIGDSMYFFAQGTANVTKNLTMKLGQSGFGKVEKSMVKLDSSVVSFFGDMAMFEEEPRSATITASTDCLVYEVKRDDFQRLCDRDPILGLKILRKIAATLCHRIRKANQDVLKLSTALSIALGR